MRTSIVVAMLALSMAACPSSGPNLNTCLPLDECHVAGTYDVKAGACTNPIKANGSACTSSDTCLTNTKCENGVCTGSGLADGTACDDHDVCTQTDVCQNSNCVGSNPITCTQDIPMCYATTACNPKTGCPTHNGPCSTTLQAPMPLSGCPDSDYFGTITVGNQNFNVIVDSGSTTLALAGGNCPTCAGLSPQYTPSGTAQDQNLKTSSIYGDGSGWYGEVYSDVVSSAGQSTPVRMRLANIYDQNRFFQNETCGTSQSYNYIQGIMGLGDPNLATEFTDSYVYKLAGDANLPPAFSVALCDFTGNLWFGGYNPNSISKPVTFTARTNTPYYSVQLNTIALNGNALPFSTFDFGTTIVDTGTSEMIFPSGVADTIAQHLVDDANFAAAFGGFSFFENGNCVVPMNGASRAQLDATLPTFSMTFPSTDLQSTFTVELPATSSYLFENPQGSTNTYCPLLGGQNFNLTILGNAIMRTQVVVFDGAGQQVGFAPQNANACL